MLNPLDRQHYGKWSHYVINAVGINTQSEMSHSKLHMSQKEERLKKSEMQFTSEIPEQKITVMM